MPTADAAPTSSSPSPLRERGVVLIVASEAGGAEREAVDTVRGILDDAGVDVREVACADPESLGDCLAERGDRVPVTCGGDGSLHLLVQALHGRGELGDTPVGLVPLGTGNDLAGGAGVPEDPAAAGRALVDGRARPLDLAEDDEGGLVVNATHLGAGALAAARGESFKPVLGPLAYKVGGVVAGVRPPRWRARVTVDGRVVHEGDLLVVAVGVGHRVGGGTPLLPGAVLDDGLLDVLVAAPDGMAARAAYAKDLAAGSHASRDDVRTVTGREVVVEVPPAAPAMPVNVDGELLGEVRRRSWRVLPSSWSLIVP